jgi:hypothetical protein
MFKAVIAASHPEFSSIRQQVCLVTSFKQKLMIYKKYLMFLFFMLKLISYFNLERKRELKPYIIIRIKISLEHE